MPQSHVENLSMTPRILSSTAGYAPNSQPAIVTRDRGFETTVRKFIMGATLDILGRAATDREVEGWVSQLASGVSRHTVLKCLLNSAEKRAHEIRRLHLTLFRRPASEGQVRFWCDRLRSGISEEQVFAELLTSVEYLAIQGKKHEDFVRALFREVLGRRPQPAEVDACVGLLDGCVASRLDLAMDLLRSDEYRTKCVRSWFRTYLHREPEEFLLDLALDKLRQGFASASVQADIMGGREYIGLKVLA